MALKPLGLRKILTKKKFTQSDYLESARNAFRQNELGRAEDLIKASIEANSGNPIAHAYYGEILLALGRPKEAGDSYQTATDICPEEGTFWHGLGLAKFRAGSLGAGINALSCAIELMPDNPEAHNNLGNLQKEAGNLRDAVFSYTRALELKPDFGEAFGNLGVVFLGLGELLDAEKALSTAAQIRPMDPVILTNLGCAFAALGRMTEATQWHRKALKLDARNTAALNNLAVSLKDQGQINDALKVYDRLIELAPEDYSARSNQLMCLNYREACDGVTIFRSHREWEKNLKKPIESFTPVNKTSRRPLKVGIVSPDLWTHSVANFLIPLLQHYDREEFHITCYSDTQVPDETTEMLKRFSNSWREIRNLSDESVSKRIRSDNINILIDLAGHTGNNRLTVFAQRVAPIQITWLGYPTTTGLSQMDFRLTDVVADPPSSTEVFHSEVLIHLQPCFLCYSPPKKIPLLKVKHRPVTFGSFNNFAKLTEKSVHLWAQLMNKVPASRLVLKSRQFADPVIAKMISDLFEGRGVEQTRVELVGRVRSRQAHLEYYNEIDIALDTFPYNGTTTTCEALLMGVPVVSRAGGLHAGRVGASLLSAMGCMHWVASHENEFLDIAVSLVNDRPSKDALRADFLGSKLCDGQGFAHSFQATLQKLWHQRHISKA